MRHGRISQRNNPIQLIVNADDFGRTEKINEGIESGFRQGIISSTSMVANSPAFAHGLKVIRENPSLGLGIHLTLTEYPPLTENEFLKKMSKHGMLAAFSALTFATSAQLRLIEQEFRRQIEKVLSHNLRLSHVDGHNHVHVHPRLIRLILRLMQEYSIRNMRLPRESLAYEKGIGRYLQKFILAVVCGLDTLPMGQNVRWPDAFHGFTEGGRLDRDKLLRILRRLKPGVNELMCHVGMENDDPPFSIGYHWLDELGAVTAFTKNQLRTEYGIHVISYQEIRE